MQVEHSVFMRRRDVHDTGTGTSGTIQVGTNEHALTLLLDTSTYQFTIRSDLVVPAFALVQNFDADNYVEMDYADTGGPAPGQWPNRYDPLELGFVPLGSTVREIYLRAEAANTLFRIHVYERP